jgi:hypothetical protein
MSHSSSGGPGYTTGTTTFRVPSTTTRLASLELVLFELLDVQRKLSHRIGWCLVLPAPRRFIQSCDPSEVDGQRVQACMHTYNGSLAPLLNHHTERQPFASSVPALPNPWPDPRWAAKSYLLLEPCPGNPACGGDSRDVFVDVRSWINVSVILIPFWSN